MRISDWSSDVCSSDLEVTFARLMAAAQKGDKTAYNVLLSETGMWLERYFRRRVPPHQLEDLVQDVLLALHAKRSTRSEERRVGKESVSHGRSRWAPYH